MKANMIPLSDPLARAIRDSHRPGVRVYASVGNELFTLDSWSLVGGRCSCDEYSLETAWTPYRHVVGLWAIPLRWKINDEIDPLAPPPHRSAPERGWQAMTDLDEWRREVASMTEQQRSVTETDCRRALGVCGEREDARDE